MNKQYKLVATEREARPRSKRLRELGGMAGMAGGSTVVNVIGSESGSTSIGHTHANKNALDQISVDTDGYQYLTQVKEVLNEETGITEVQTTTEKVKAGYADEAELANKATEAEHAAKAYDLDEDSPVYDKVLSSVEDDEASGVIRFLKGLLLGKNGHGISVSDSGVVTAILDELKNIFNIVSPDFVSGDLGNGFILKYDQETGRSYLEVDELLVRKLAYFVELVIKQLRHVGGEILLTPASMKCVKVEEVGGVYRCYFEQDNGSKSIKQEFVAGDQARAQTFNIKEGTSHNVSNRYYWRLVTAVGDDYIDLSKTDCDTGSSIPEAGDDIVQLGNRSGVTRQSAIILSTVGDDAPSIKQYKGINSYNIAGKEVTIISPVLNKFMGEFISIATGKSYDEMFEALQVDMDLIKGQTDKEYTMWFFEYVPTLSNIPASEWTTDALKVMHEQDMFYNRASGLAYRFEKSGGAWVWNPITDQYTLKALENAAKAQDTADGKRRVFVAQPTNAQAYDVGDLWTNATYPSSKPYTYQNDSLVCKTAKAAGAAFSIDHWKSSSTATTAYLENLGDRIVAGVTESDKKIEAVKKLAEDGISSATGIANDAISGLRDAMKDIGDLSGNLDGLLDDINGVNKTMTEHTTAIQLTKESIALLAQGKEKDADGNVVSVSKGGLVTTAYFNTLFSERVKFDEDGHIINVSKSGLVTTADFSELFAQKADADGYVKKSYIQLFITELPDGRFQSNALVSADLIRFNGKIVANDTFVVDENGDLTLNRITANNGVFRGRVEAEEGYFRGKVTTAINGKRIEVDPEENNIKMYDSQGKIITRIYFTEYGDGSIGTGMQMISYNPAGKITGSTKMLPGYIEINNSDMADGVGATENWSRLILYPSSIQFMENGTVVKVITA